MKNNSNFIKNNPWWRPAMYFYIRTTPWILIPLGVAIIFNSLTKGPVSSQAIFFVFVTLAFLVTCYGIYSNIKKYNVDIDNQSKTETK